MLEIRLAIEKDLPQLADFMSLTFHETYTGKIDETEIQNYIQKWFNLNKVTEEWQNQNWQYVLLCEGDTLVGFAHLKWNSVHERMESENACEISRIYVLGNQQGRGAGRFLMEYIFTEAHKYKKDYVWLGVWENNMQAIGYYRYFGFEKTADIPFVMGKEVQNDYLMVKKL